MGYIDKLDAALKDLVDAAIEADMYERDYWAHEGSRVFYNYALHKEIHRGNPGANDLGVDEDDHTDYEAEVFGFWPGEIDTVFEVWRGIPDPDDFERDVARLVALAGRNVLEPRIEPPRDLLSGDLPDFPSSGFGRNLQLVTSRAGDLYGRWAEAFHDNYVVPLPWVLANQQAMIAILASVVSSEAEVWRRAQEGVLAVATAGATWFRSTTGSVSAAETTFDVASALNDGFQAVKDGISLNPFDIIDAVGDLGQAGESLRSAIEASSPTHSGGGSWASVGSVYTAIAQTLEYTLNRQVLESEEQLQKVMRAGIDAMTGSAATFVMGDNHLEQVRNGDAILDRGGMNIHRPTVNRLITAMRELGTSVSEVGTGIRTSTQPWIRPGSIGLGVEGPYRTLLALENAVIDAMYDTGSNLQHVARAVELAAEYAYAADENAQAELDRLDRRLDSFQDRLGDLPDDLPPREVETYYVPPGELYVDQEDCLPGQGPLFPEPQGPLAPAQP